MAEDTSKEIAELQETLKAAEDEKRVEAARAIMREKEAKRAAAKAAKEAEAQAKAGAPAEEGAEAKPQYPHPTLKPGSILPRAKQEEFLLVVNRDLFYKLAVQHVLRASPGYAIPNMRQIAAALGVQDFNEAQEAWRKIQSEHERRIQYA